MGLLLPVCCLCRKRLTFPTQDGVRGDRVATADPPAPLFKLAPSATRRRERRQVEIADTYLAGHQFMQQRLEQLV